MTTKAYNEGSDARKQGKDSTSCPYPRESLEHEEWMDGWLDIDRKNWPATPRGSVKVYPGVRTGWV